MSGQVSENAYEVLFFSLCGSYGFFSHFFFHWLCSYWIPLFSSVRAVRTSVANNCSVLYLNYTEHIFECQYFEKNIRTFFRNICLPWMRIYVILNIRCRGQKSPTLMPAIPDFSVLSTFVILRTFVIRSFFFETWLLTHVLGGSRGQKPSCKQACISFLTFWPWHQYKLTTGLFY